MTHLYERAAGPANAAGRLAVPTRRACAPRLILRRSATLHAVAAFGLAIATSAVFSTLSDVVAAFAAGMLTLAFLAAGLLAARAWSRNQPAAIEIVADELTVFSFDGRCLVRGRVSAYAQWGSALLVLSVQASDRRCAFLIVAEALSTAGFRELALLCRRATGR